MVALGSDLGLFRLAARCQYLPSVYKGHSLFHYLQLVEGP